MNKLLDTTFEIFCPSHMPEKQQRVIDHFDKIGFECKKFDGTGYNSWSKLQNDCIKECKADVYIYVSHKNILFKNDLIKMISMIKSGFGIVGLFDITAYAAPMNLFRKVGFFDERYFQGGFDEYDMFYRCCQNNIAIYLNRESYYSGEKSTWVNQGILHYKKKWIEAQDDNILEKLLDEEYYGYDIGKLTPHSFLPWKHSFVRDLEKKKLNYLEWKVRTKNSFFL
jgi:hypothetical protein